MKITAGATLQRYADVFDIPIAEVVDWVNGYVNHPEREAPEQFKSGLIEESEKDRFDSIAAYIKRRIEETADARIIACLASNERKAA